MARSVVDWVKVWSCFTDGDLLPASFALFFSSSFSYFGVRVSASFWFFSVSSAVAGARDWLRSTRLLFRFFFRSQIRSWRLGCFCIILLLFCTYFWRSGVPPIGFFCFFNFFPPLLDRASGLGCRHFWILLRVVADGRRCHMPALRRGLG